MRGKKGLPTVMLCMQGKSFEAAFHLETLGRRVLDGKWSSLNIPRHLNPLVSSILGKGKFSQLPLLALWGNKNGLTSMKVKKFEKIQSECPRDTVSWLHLAATANSHNLDPKYYEDLRHSPKPIRNISFIE